MKKHTQSYYAALAAKLQSQFVRKPPMRVSISHMVVAVPSKARRPMRNAAQAWLAEYNRLRAMGVHNKACEYFAGIARRAVMRGDKYRPYRPDRNVRKDLTLCVPPNGPTLDMILDRKRVFVPVSYAAHGQLEKKMRAEQTVNVTL